MDKNTFDEKKFKAFVIMPFEEEFNTIYEKLIKPGLLDFEVKRADSIASQQNILKDIIRGIADADLVIADLTSENPNVFYELGISHTLGKKTVLLTQSLEDVPFDLKSNRMISYSLNFAEAPKLTDTLKDIGELVKKGDINFGNPVLDFLPQHKKNGIPSTLACNEDSVKKENIKYPEIVEEKGILDYAAGIEDSNNNLTNYMQYLTDATISIGDKMDKRKNEALSVKQSQSKNKASQIHKIAKASASDMVIYAKILEDIQPKLHNEWQLFHENTSNFCKIAKIQNDEEKESVQNLHTEIKKSKKVLETAIEQIRNYRDVLKGLNGISREVNQASKRTAKILDFLATDIEGANSNFTKLMTLIDEKLDSLPSM